MGMQLAGGIENVFMHQHCNICCGILSPTTELPLPLMFFGQPVSEMPVMDVHCRFSRPLMLLAIILVLLAKPPVSLCMQRSAFLRVKAPKTERLDGIISIHAQWSIIQCGNACLANSRCDGISYGLEFSSIVCYLHEGKDIQARYPSTLDYYEIQRSSPA